MCVCAWSGGVASFVWLLVELVCLLVGARVMSVSGGVEWSVVGIREACGMVGRDLFVVWGYMHG